jgi:CRP-like cAMP-binding protein
MFFSSGRVARWTERDGVFKRVRSLDQHSIGFFYFLIDEPTRFNVRADTEVVAYELEVEEFKKFIQEYPQIMIPVAKQLAKQIRLGDSREISSGLLEQKGVVSDRKVKNKTAYTATALACVVESFYRSAMNNFMNSQLAGKPIGPFLSWFPRMHVQIPTRIVYISGLKEIRRVFGEIDPYNRILPASLIRIILSFAPGAIMCPISSVLEATVAHGNKEPLRTKWTRGFVPRFGREVVFGIGINQLSDYCREQVPSSIQNQHVRTALGSITSGILSGYFSQIPHNLSTMKLMEPHRSYRDLWAQLARNSEKRVPDFVPENMKNACANFMALALPMGCLRRSLQIGGSFIIINGLIYTWRNKNWI